MKTDFLKLYVVFCIALICVIMPQYAVADSKIDIMFAKGFASYTTSSFSVAGTDRTDVANSTNATGVKYAMQVFNGSTGAVRGNQSAASSNFSCRNTTTYSGYYISKVTLTVSGGTLDGSTSGRSVVFFGSSEYSSPSSSAPSGSSTSSKENASEQATLTWENSDQSVSYFILYNLKTSGTALSAGASTALKVTWTEKAGSSCTTNPTLNAAENNGSFILTSPKCHFSESNYVFYKQLCHRTYYSNL